MAENTDKMDLLLQNNGSKQFFVYSGLTNKSGNHLWVEFDEDLSDLPAGEYTYATIINNRNDVKYEFKTPLLSTILHTEDGDVVLANLHPSTGLLQIGELGQTINIYEEDTPDPDNNNANNNIWFYDGD